ncbi:MAG: K(+)-stimulated pyrophosphate-energized sodium pump [Thermomicrobiales bacterium]|nr:K(+)-stimulated pyrophosphate-energized sodium pump [Thermomicrobiales bacterium]MEA2528048.1 K(+)-stimulated pyrophosphate-energized sodium pump [Thermomicrobiales bacterium]MEA2585147.1 K(+)-stimulated pyrophosphate-energized sodium pump [Thermomicrobiales bacterium]MEA2593875.1 K(+)-stimulated pyrophosphate-energized sodium pump [Thermomicrobiales bacterium]
MDEKVLYMLPVLIFGVLAILFAGWLARDVFSRDQGTTEMQDIAGRIFEGALAYLKRQYRTIALLAIVVAVVIGVLVALFEKDHETERGIITAVAFLVGAALSGLSGFIGMYVAVRSNIRTAAGARKNLGEALIVALRGGAVSGFLVVALALLGVGGVYAVVYQFAEGAEAKVAETPYWIVGFAFGASFVALFAQLGGGIYTKAADVGADLVGKVEAGIPEDDPRNPAVIADLVGDNVGDCAGRGADIFESSAAEFIGAMVLGVALFRASGAGSGSNDVAWIFLPLVLGAFGLLCSLVGVLSVRPSANPGDPMAVMNRGFYVTAGLSVVALFGVCAWMLDEGWLTFALCGVIGIATSFAFVYITQYYTSGAYRPVKEIAEQSRRGTATNIISGLSVGMETTGMPALVIGAAILSSYSLGNSVDFGSEVGISAGIFGTAVATLGMLMSAAYILAMDCFGPITDNAGGIVEMSDQPESVREVTDALDSAGNTTKALTKGYAVGTASLAAFLLFSAFLDEVKRFGNFTEEQMQLRLSLTEPKIFVGGLIGAALVFVFASFSIRAVGRAAGDMIEEVRRQFREDPGIMKGTSKPDYARCVDISVRSSLREMVRPGVLAVAVPVLVGVILGWEAAAGMLMIGTITGVLMALFLNNGGGAWDNAKKFIEAGGLKDESGKVLGKGSDAHAAAVVGDTVGDPFKDTAGPSLHVLIKLLATITLVLSPLFI